MTDSLGQSQVLPYLKGLSKLGYTISLISCEKKNRYAEFKDQIIAICKEANIMVSSTIYKKTTFIIHNLGYSLYQQTSR